MPSRALSRWFSSSPSERAMAPLRDEINQLFDEFSRGFGTWPWGESIERWGQFTPKVDVSETDKMIEVRAELPGLAEKDFSLMLNNTGDVLTLKGEKTVEKREEDKDKSYYRMERSYGSFQRVIPLPSAVDASKVEAIFSNGLLSVKLPRLETREGGAKKIKVTSA